jgi:hypothetical protein
VSYNKAKEIHMQVAKKYVATATKNMEHALSHMPIVSAGVRLLPTTMQEITGYVEQLLTPDEHAICDMATD